MRFLKKEFDADSAANWIICVPSFCLTGFMLSSDLHNVLEKTFAWLITLFITLVTCFYLSKSRKKQIVLNYKHTLNAFAIIFILSVPAKMGLPYVFAKLGDPAFEMRLAFRALKNNDEAQAEEWFNQAANTKNPQYELVLGEMYLQGNLGIKQNYEKAFKWLSQSANQGNAEAQYNLGVIFLKGYGVSKNPPEGFIWFKKSADQKYGQAMIALSTVYSAGAIVPKDNKNACFWANQALDTPQVRHDAKLKLQADNLLTICSK